MLHQIRVRYLGLVDYQHCLQQMEDFIAQHQNSTHSELWILQHPPVYTLGQAAKKSHILKETAIPMIQTNRGGQVTYHAPGQLIAYCLFNLKALNIGVKSLVYQLEQAVIDVLKEYGITGQRKKNAPGVYVQNAKIAALGLRIRHGYSFHGIAFNIDMDLTPYQNINPCGYVNLPICQLSQLTPCRIEKIEPIFAKIVIKNISTY